MRGPTIKEESVLEAVRNGQPSMRANGQETRGQGSASSTITSTLRNRKRWPLAVEAGAAFSEARHHSFRGAGGAYRDDAHRGGSATQMDGGARVLRSGWGHKPYTWPQFYRACDPPG